MEEPALSYYAYGTVLWACGLIIHFIKKCTREQIGFKHYWMNNKSTSIQSIVAGVAALTGLFYTGETTIIAFFSAGYICDSLLNKVE